MSIVFFYLMLSMSAVTVTTDEIVEAAVGTNVTFPCQTVQDSNTVVWHQYPIGSKLAKIIYLNGEVFEAYQDSFRVTESGVGFINLMILGVRLGDSAKYTCTSGKKIRSFELTVLELYPSPQSCASNSSGVNIIGRNSCGIEPEVVRLNCTLRYQGNFQPFLEWKSTIGNPVFSIQKLIEDRTTVSTVILKADEQKSVTYTCFIKYFNTNFVSSFSWSLEVNTITLFNQTREYNPDCDTESVPCSVNTTTDCSYTWVNNKSEEIASGSTLFLQNHQEGQYICRADCWFRKKHRCLFEPVKVNNTCGGYVKHTVTGVGGIVGIVFGVAVTVAIIIVFIFLFRSKPNQRRRGEHDINERLNQVTSQKQENNV